MAKRLTQKGVENLGIKRNAYIAWDALATGLGIKITPTGKRIWVAQLKYPDHEVQTKRTLGHFPALGLEAARTKAAAWYTLCKEGVDPADVEADKAKAAEASRRAEAIKKANTFGAFAEKFIAGRTNRRRDA